jgi:chloride channel 7
LNDSPGWSYRSAISLVVLMVEGTRGVDYIFGIILAVVVANYVANFIHHDGECEIVVLH